MNTQARTKVVSHYETNAQETSKKGTKNKINKQNTISRHALYKMVSHSHRDYTRSAACSFRL